MSEEDSSLSTLVVAFLEREGVDLLESRLEDSLHLRPMWERMRVGESDGRTFIGLPITSKVTSDTIENHARHLHSLLRLLDLRLTTSHEQVATVEVETATLRSLVVRVSSDD